MHQRPLLRTLPAPHERRGQLRRVARPKDVRVGKILRERAHLLARQDLIPSGAKLMEQPDRLRVFFSREPRFPNQSSEGTPRRGVRVRFRVFG